MTFKVSIFLTCLLFVHNDAKKIQCLVGGTGSQNDSQLWKLDGSILQNKEGIWKSNDMWNFTSKEDLICIENINKTKFWGTTNDSKVILENFEKGKAQQLWKKGEPNAEGYFTLENSGVPKVITAISKSGLEIADLDSEFKLQALDCPDGITQCMKSAGPYLGDLTAYVFSCSDKYEVHHEGCTTMYLLSKGYLTTCYCTGDKCTPTNSANNIGAQVTIGFAVFVAFFNKIMA